MHAHAREHLRKRTRVQVSSGAAALTHSRFSRWQVLAFESSGLLTTLTGAVEWVDEVVSYE
eukprot:3739549-Pleurochrysis_carterae.AAC.1